MIIEVMGDLLETQNCQVICHQCNLYHTFGAGIAKSIKDKFPEAYVQDRATSYGDPKKLGSYSSARVSDPQGTSILYIINLYCQDGIGGQDRRTSYDAMVKVLETLHSHLLALRKKGKLYSLGIPYKMGAGLANGNWNIIRAIIESVFETSPMSVYIYRLPGVE
jgi:O-acetyl-ADP-ribose deacetylase (regulator of RNase III)